MSIVLNGVVVSGSGTGSNNVDKETIINNDTNNLTVVGMKTKDGSLLYDWVGTKAEYDNGILNGSISDDWVCWITDDETSSTINKRDLFDVVYKDHILSYEESFGYAQLGTYVYKEAVLNSHYGYPDFYNICLNGKQEGVSTSTTLGSKTVTLYINSDGRQYYDITDKASIDAFYEATGIAWFYGIDEANERIFLPRNDYYFINGSSDNVGKYIEEGLPSITHTHTGTTSETGAHTHTRGTMNITGNVNASLMTSSTAQSASGALTATSKGSNSKGGTGHTFTEYQIGLDASKSWTGATSSNGAHKHTFTTSNNSSVDDIYGKSDTVQPKSVSMIAYMIVGNVLTEVGHTTIVEQMNGALLDIENAKQSSLEEITENKESSLTEITNLYNDSMSDIQSLKDTSESDITSLATSSKEELNTLRANSVTELSQLSDSSNQELNTLRDDSVSEIINLYNNSYNSIQELHDASYNNIQTETEAGVNRIQQTSNALNQTQITNCLLEVPQRIIIEENKGIVTLKAGSVLIYPNGFESDGTTRRFDYKTIETDVQVVQGNSNRDILLSIVHISENSMSIERIPLTQNFSSVEPPTGYQHMMWYDISNNIIKRTQDGGSTWGELTDRSLPFAEVREFADGTTHILYTFNGFGFMGSTWWIDKDVKALISKGYNSDGTINNLVVKTVKVGLINQSAADRLVILNAKAGLESMIRGHYFISEEQPDFAISASNLWYNPKTLEWKHYNATLGEWLEEPALPIAWDKKNSDGVIIDFGFHLNNTFRAMDYKEAKDQLDALASETVKKSGDTMTGNLILHGASGQRVFYIINESDYNVAPTVSTGVGKLQVADRNSNIMMQVGCERYTDNRTSAILRVSSPADPSKMSTIAISAKADGTFYTQAPTPPTGDNSTKIATTAWVNSNSTSINDLAPDWSSKISVSSLPYTAPCDGWWCHYGINQSGTVAINGVAIDTYSWAANNWPGHQAVQILLSPGDVVSIASGGAPSNKMFIPCKGVN